jgi:hypothetical protein
VSFNLEISQYTAGPHACCLTQQLRPLQWINSKGGRSWGCCRSFTKQPGCSLVGNINTVALWLLLASALAKACAIFLKNFVNCGGIFDFAGIAFEFPRI